jgi:hypothetical protein
MKCEKCQSKKHVFDFNNRCCLVRWLRGAYHPHAKSYLDQYRIRNGESEMLKLIAEVKDEAR